MLLRSLVLVAFVAVLGETIVSASAALARMSFHAKEHTAIRSAFSAALAQAQTAAITGAIPQPSATCAYADERGCAITVRTTIATPSPVPGATPTACPGSNCTIYTQTNTHVTESRASFMITEQVLAANGDVMMTRSGGVSFRTFATAPYASLVGSLDETLDALNNGGTGDDGGNAWAGSATLIHVQYQQSATGSREPGDVWRAQDQHPATAAPGWDN